ncbi:hypothetical protein COLO4_00763 [Corchorus olitorius]|uniref:Uncharacterized protein n=1 Tax=Corchorus olitorius TaxID=93759 RepID=A0A1R3L3D2_9ROSI|nr:hypothetical protein COLO4_00763 [Corchorus olitorius]
MTEESAMRNRICAKAGWKPSIINIGTKIGARIDQMAEPLAINMHSRDDSSARPTNAVKHRHELGQREHHHDKARHLFHRLDHQLRQITLTADFAGGDTVGERNDKEEEDNQRHDALNKRRRQDGMFNRIAQYAVFRHHHQRHRGDKRQRDNPRHAQAEALRFAQRLQLFIATAFPFAQARLDDLIGNQPADNRQENDRACHKVPVVDHADVHGRINGFRRLRTDAREQHVGGDDQQVSGKTAAHPRNRGQQARHGMAPGGEEDQRPHRRHDHQRGVGGDMAEEGDKQHHVARVPRADVRSHLHHQCGQQANAFSQPGAQHQRQNGAERGESAEVFNHVG